MGIIRSEKRSPILRSFEISKDIILTSTGAVNINVPFIVNHVDFFPSSFKLEVNEKVVYIDPVIIDEDVPADYILITHSHPDHFSKNDIKKLLKKETIVICPKIVHKKLSKELSNYSVMITSPGYKKNFGIINVESISSYNVSSGFFVPHPKSAANVGYIINIGDVNIYHTGDTDYTPKMMQLNNITIALTPIDGGNLTMSTEKAAEFINNLNPKFVVPMHYNIGTDEVRKFKELVNSHINVIILDGE